MAWLILIGFLLFTTIVYVYLQKLVMKLPHKIWHFVPIIFFCVLTVYGYLRSNRVIVYYSDYDNDWTNGVIEFVTGIHGFLTSLITMVIIYLQQRKRPASPAGKVRKVFAVTVSVFMIAFTVFNPESVKLECIKMLKTCMKSRVSGILSYIFSAPIWCKFKHRKF